MIPDYSVFNQIICMDHCHFRHPAIFLDTSDLLSKRRRNRFIISFPFQSIQERDKELMFSSGIAIEIPINGIFRRNTILAYFDDPQYRTPSSGITKYRTISINSILKKDDFLFEYQGVKEFKPKYQIKVDRFFFIPEEVHILPESSSIMIRNNSIVGVDTPITLNIRSRVGGLGQQFQLEKGKFGRSSQEGSGEVPLGSLALVEGSASKIKNCASIYVVYAEIKNFTITCLDASKIPTFECSIILAQEITLFGKTNMCGALSNGIRDMFDLVKSVVLALVKYTLIKPTLMAPLQSDLQSLSLVDSIRMTDDGLKHALEVNPRLIQLDAPGHTRLNIECVVVILKAYDSMCTQGVSHLYMVVFNLCMLQWSLNGRSPHKHKLDRELLPTIRRSSSPVHVASSTRHHSRFQNPSLHRRRGLASKQEKLALA
ncbi:hypothetical protein VNO77_23066 [Canavalia gladiata]|uniref:Uncharacterized protein n=1 Tax=Canavalia gladiata TaxID=3824 RepID=A0AAN9L918_CANGL